MTVKSAATLIQPNRDDRLRQALQARYERADRITSTNSTLSVKVLRPDEVPGEMKTVPGWTDGHTVYINDAVLQVSKMDDSGLIAALGVNLHELAHTMFTPNLKGWLAREVANHGATAWHCFNILEDQRAESFFSARFSDARKFYTPMVMRWLLNEESQKGNYVLLYGRRYLPFDLIQHMRDQFVRPDLASDFEDVIDSYRSLDVHRFERDAYKLIMDFNDLMAKLRETVSQPDLTSGHKSSSEARRDESRTGDMTPDGEQTRELSERVKNEERPETIEDALDTPGDDDDEDAAEEPLESGDAGDESDADAEGEPADGEGEAEGEAADSDGDAAADGDSDGDDDNGTPADGGDSGDASDDGSIERDEGDEVAEGDDSPEGSGGTGAGTGAPTEGDDAPSIEDLEEYLRQALDKVASDKDVADELSETRSDVAISSHGVMKPQLPELSGNLISESPLTIDLMGHVKATTKRLQEARVGAETTLKRQVRHGSLNPLSLHKAQPGDLDVFDDWEAGLVGEEGEMDVALLLDISGSMNYIINDAAFTLYAIKRAFESLGDAHVTAWTYTGRGNLLYDRKERVSNAHYKVPRASGGTQPSDAIEDALRVLGTTKSKLRLLIIVTDGGWAAPHLGEDLIAQANLAGVVTVLVGLNGAVSFYGSHGCKVSRDLTQPSDLPEVAGDIAAAMVNTAERNARRE